VREKLNLSQEDLARALNVSFATINRWENSKNKPVRMAQAAFNDFCIKHNIVFDNIDDGDQNTLPVPEPMDVKKLCSFIPYFENIDPDKACQWVSMKKSEDGVITLPYPVYSDDFMKFVDAFYKSGLSVNNYQDELNRRVPDWQTKDIQKVIETADIELVRVVLTKLIRVERFSDGAWDNAIKSGLFLAILRKFKALTINR
ncbi:MAG: helix-turn-helix transcriptional regulator, partial [Chitinispirillales bacterium]|nr:helix-turn-helix transcriptional regulator [Chitinispirillales bacterium]